MIVAAQDSCLTRGIQSCVCLEKQDSVGSIASSFLRDSVKRAFHKLQQDLLDREILRGGGNEPSISS